MPSVVTINKQPVQVKEYNGQRVVTFREIDKVHGRPEGTASRAFRENRKHFIEGKDYFRRNSSEAKIEFNTIAPNGLILITESGYLMLVKSFTDPLAWKVQRQLVDTYFHAKEEQLTIQEAYQYQPKSYKGRQVITFRDLEYFTGKPAKSLCRVFVEHIKKFRAGIDYWLLLGEDLNGFKRANRITNHPMRHLYILTRSGFQKLARIFQTVPRSLEKKCFPLPAPVPAQESPKAYKVDYDNSPVLQKRLDVFDKKIKNIYGVLSLIIGKKPTEEQYQAYLQTIRDLALDAACYTVTHLPEAEYSKKPC